MDSKKIALIYLIIKKIEELQNQKTKILFHIMENLNSKNQYIRTQEEIAKKLKISKKTVTETTKTLKEANIIKNINSGIYQINTEIIFKDKKITQNKLKNKKPSFC